MNETETRSVHKENIKGIKKPEKNNKKKWGILSLVIILLVGILSYFIFKEPSNKVEAELDINKILTGVKYEADLVEEDGELYVIVVGKDLTQEDTVTLADEIKESEGKELTVYTFDKSPETKERPDFYADNLIFETNSLPNDAYEIKQFLSLPTVEANVEAVKDWQIDAEESYIDKDGVLQAFTSVPTSAKEEDTVALLKGLDGMVGELNDKEFKAVQFNVKSGLRQYTYHTKYNDVLAQTFNLQMKDAK